MISTLEKVKTKMLFMISILGESFFYKILSFFVEIMLGTEEIKILMTRRLYDLYSAFEEIVEFLYEDKIKPRGRIVTNLSVVLEERNLKKSNILLIDDIILHGRTLNEEYKYLVTECGCKSDKIRAKVLLQNIDKKLIDSELLKKLDVSEKVDDETWRILSSKIIYAFFAVGQPYISYLPYVEYNLDAPIGNFLKEFIQDRERVYEITTDIQKYYGIASYLYCADDKMFDRKIEIAQANLIRIYILNKLNKTIMIPYCYLYPIRKKSISCVFQKIEDQHYFQYDNNHGCIENMWWRVHTEDVDAHNRFMYSAITYLTSMMLGNVFFKSKGIEHVDWKENMLSLGFKSAECLRGREEDLIFYLNKFKSSFITSVEGRKLKVELSEEIQDIYRNIILKKGNLSHFIRECGKRDEQRASINQPRIKGISIWALRDMFKIDDVKTIWCKAISLADAGQVTIIVSPEVIDKQECVSSLLVAGEQNPTCNEENRIALALPLIEFSNFCTLNGLDFSTLKNDLIDKICSSYPEIKKNLLPDELNEVVNGEVTQYRNYYVERLPIYANSSILKGALNIEVQYEKR